MELRCHDSVMTEPKVVMSDFGSDLWVRFIAGLAAPNTRTPPGPDNWFPTSDSRGSY